MSVNRAFFLFGVATLLPWNCLMSAMGFMDNTVFKGLGWTVTITPLFQFSGLFTQLLLLGIGHMLPTKIMLFLVFPLGILGALLMLFLCSMTTADIMNNTTRFYCAVITCLGLSIVANGMLQSLAGMLVTMLVPEHPALPAMYVNGIAVAGVMSFVVSIMVTAGAGHRYAVDALFLLLAMTYVCCFIDFLYIARLGLVRDNCKSTLTADALNLHDGTQPGGAGSPRALEGIASRRPSRLSRAISRGSTIGGTLRREWKQQVNLFVIYVQTFLVFPVVSSNWRCRGDLLAPETYVLAMVSVFQIGDLAGRLICTVQSFSARCPSGDKLWMVVAARSVLLPLFFLCWRIPASGEWLFGNIGFQVVLMLFFSFTNGAFTTLAFMRGASGIQAEDRDVVGRALPLALTTGIVAGSVCSSGAVMWLGTLG